MEISQEMINKITAMNEAELKKAIGQIADALGASQSQKRMAVNNAGFIKRKINKMSKNEMQAFVSKVPPEKAEELKKTLGL
jgi:adenine C2-methylase RlmN of 23S rRNA A2503 and tRNA A37